MSRGKIPVSGEMLCKMLFFPEGTALVGIEYDPRRNVVDLIIDHPTIGFEATLTNVNYILQKESDGKIIGTFTNSDTT